MKLKHLGLIDKFQVYKSESYNHDWEEEDKKFMDQYQSVAIIAYLYYINYLSTSKCLIKTVGEFSNNSWNSVHVSVSVGQKLNIILGFSISRSSLCQKIIRFSCPE